MNSYAVAAAVATVLCLLLLIGPSFRKLSTLKRGILILLRLVVILLIVVAILRPTRISTTTTPQSAVLVMMVDQSRSMQLPHSSGQQSRWAAQREVLDRARPVLLELADKMETTIHGYDMQLHPIELTTDGLMLPESADGEQTDIGSTLHEALQGQLGKRLAAVVLLGDGAQTAFDPAVEIQEAGRELARLGHPLYTVAFGPPGDVVQARDVAVENLQDQYTVFVKNELPLRAAVRVHGYVNKEIPVELLVESPDGETETIGPKTVMAREDGQQVAIEMKYVPEHPGRYKLTLRANEQPGELVTKNNQLSAFLRVLEGGLKVLYLEGALRWEQEFLRRSLDASPDIELDFRWMDSSRRGEQVVDLSRELSAPKYDAFIIGDVDATVLGDVNLKLLAEAVDKGKGIALLGGTHSFGAGSYFDTPLAEVMPILMDRLEKQDFDAPIREDLHVKGPLRVLPVRSHPVTALAADNENDAFWERLPPLKGANKFVGIKDAAGVSVLCETGDGEPILIAGEYGGGRVLVMAADSTWRWWMQGHQAAHKRFWRQTILWLVRRDEQEGSDIWVGLQRRRFNPGANVSFSAGANTAAGEAIDGAVLRAELIMPDQQRRPLRLARDGDHWAGVTESVEQPGDYIIEVTAEKDAELIGTARGEFLVFDRDVELSNAAADHDQLARLAALTKEFGGRSVAPEQLVGLLEELRDRPPEMEIEVQTKWQLADSETNAWPFFLCLIVLLTIEWALRKRWSLV